MNAVDTLLAGICAAFAAVVIALPAHVPTPHLCVRNQTWPGHRHGCEPITTYEAEGRTLTPGIELHTTR